MVLHWSNDPLGQMIQCQRALRPDGLFLGVMMGGKTLLELRGAFAQAETKILDGLSPRVLPMSDIRDIGTLLQRAGFAMPVVDSMLLPVTYETPLNLMRDLRDICVLWCGLLGVREPHRRPVAARSSWACALCSHCCRSKALAFGAASTQQKAAHACAVHREARPLSAHHGLAAPLRVGG